MNGNTARPSEGRLVAWVAALVAVLAMAPIILFAVSVLLVALPLIGMVLAAAVLWRSWRSDAALRADTRLAAGLLGRLVRKPLVWLSTAVLLVGTLFGIAALVHGITG